MDGKNVTPKSLIPGAFVRDVKVEGSDVDGLAKDRGADDDELAQQAAQMQPFSPNEKAKAQKPAGLSTEELGKNVDIVLTETETDMILYFPSLCVALDNPQSQEVTARNKAYEDLCNSKADSDQYREQHAQTLNQPHKSKEVFAAPPSQESVEVNANRWDIHDTFATDPVPKYEQIQQACDRESALQVAQAIKKPGCLFTMNEPYPSADVPKEDKGKPKEKARGAKGGPGTTASASTSGGVGGSKVFTSGAVAASANVSQTGVASGTPVGDDGRDVECGSPASRLNTPGDPANKEDAAMEEAKKEKPEPIDQIPWKVGANNPIPEELSQALRTMERIVSQNVFHKEHMIYRNYPTLEELAGLTNSVGDDPTHVEHNVPEEAANGTGRHGSKDVAENGDAVAADAGETEVAHAERHTSGKPSLQDLFCFEAPQLTQGMTVTSAEWNRHNQDLLAVSYGDVAPVPNNPGGLVLFWSLKNPTYPERVMRVKTGVTVLNFSSVHPNMVAAGTHDGSVMIWDLRRPTDVPVLRSVNEQKHTDIVWETRWVDRGVDKQPQELLVSVSSDGCVYQWSMKKGLEQTPLMSLKRLPNPHLGANSVHGHKEGIVFRKSSGFCVDFPRHDPSTYLVGTEDGLVHRCSTSYNEQYLDTFYGHSGPVYRVRCNPFMSHAFLTCSADWTMKLWTTKPPQGHPSDQPLLTFQSTDLSDAVNDVIWHPSNSTSFAASMDDGRVELWDLAEKPLDPIVVHYPRAHEPRRRRTCVRFSPNSPVLVAGDDQGSVDVMRMYNTNQSYYSEQEQQERLNSVMVKKR
jgi:WD40 repeat protein